MIDLKESKSDLKGLKKNWTYKKEDKLKIKVYRLRIYFKSGEKKLFLDFDFYFKDEKYEKTKELLRRIGQVKELFAWSW